MASPLVETKLYMPRLRRDLFARPRLRDRLSRGSQSRLTVVSAPAGFGKTTVLIDWLSAAPAEEQAVAWLSLDEGDSDPALFWTYLITALQTAAPGVGASALPLLQSARPPIETVLTTVLNELRALPYELYVVLDHYHLAPRRGSRLPGGHGVPARPSPAAGASGDQHPIRSGFAAGTAAGPWGAGRAS